MAACYTPLLMLQLLLLTEASPPEGSQGQGRGIPPFSPSIELARSLGSSPVTPEGRESQGRLLTEGMPDYFGGGHVDGEEESCPPRMPPEHVWKRTNTAVRATLPHQEFSSCSPPLKCSVTTTVHRTLFLQEGDTLEVVLQTSPDYAPPTTSRPHPPAASSTASTTAGATAPPTPTPTAGASSTRAPSREEEEKTTAMDPIQAGSLRPTAPTALTERRTPSPQEGLRQPNGSVSPEDLPDGTSSGRSRRKRASGGEEEEDEEEEEEEKEHDQPTSMPARRGSNETSLSPLTIWRASLAEWNSCSTREGSQVGESGAEGVVAVGPRDLQTGTNYFIGRSSWSSTECFKLKVKVRSAECGEGSLCSGKGICHTDGDMERFECRCCEGFIGPHCEEMNACTANPCLNAGMCVDIQEGHDGDTFQCLCLYGFSGRYCQEKTNLCESVPCSNGGTCTGNHSSYSCRCPEAWSGPQCTEPSSPIDSRQEEEGQPEGEPDCTAGPCLNGVCVETSSLGVKCFCIPGYGGERCEFEYNECDSNPCENGGTCTDEIGRYKCHCGRGYTGQRCQMKYNLCSPNPCPASRVCVDKGNSYSCECLNGLNEDNCGPHTQLCSPNPCDNGGTCWIVPDAHMFFCTCRAGFTGNTCQGILQENSDEAVPERVDAVGTVESVPMEGHLAMEMPLYHLKNIYVAIATLASALLIFALVVGVCHCRVNRTYRKCFVKSARPNSVFPSVRRPRPTSFFDKPRRGDRNGSLRLEADPDGASMPMTSANANSDAVYYNMDLCDNQELPLIK